MLSTWPSRFAALFAALAFLLALVVGVLAFGSLSVDAERLRAPLDLALTRALGRAVEIAGPARLTLSFQPSLTVHDVRVANPAGFGEAEFGTISELRLDTELLPLLRQQLIVNELHGRGVVVRLARSGEGRGNWIFEPEPRAEEAKSQSRFQLDWRRVVFEEAKVEYTLADTLGSVQLDSLVLEGLSGRPLQLALQGSGNKQIPFQGEADSAPLTELAGQEPWPFKARMEAPQTVASIDGTRQPAAEGPLLRLQIAINTTDVDEIGALLGITLPVAGAASLAGELEFAPGMTVMRQLSLESSGVAVSGEVSFNTRGPRPSLSGHLAMPEVDLGRVVAAEGNSKQDLQTVSALYDVFRESELHLARLSQFDADVSITIGRLVDSPGDVRDVGARVQLDTGRLSMPITATVGDATIEAELSADATNGVPAFGLQLRARDAPIDGLALLLDRPHVVGTIQRFDADFNASGRTLAELVGDLEGRVTMEGARLTFVDYEGGHPSDLHIAAADLAQARGQTLAATARGSLRSKAFEASLGADTLERLLSERQTPFQFNAASAGVRLHLLGVLAQPGADSGPDIELELTALQARELAPWLGSSSQSTEPVAVRGRVQVRENGVKLSPGSLVFGRSSVKGELDWERIDGKARVKADLVAELLAPAELGGLRDVPPPAHQRSLIDLAILPEALDLGDADLELTVKAVHGLALDLTDLTFNGRVRNGVIEPSPFSLRLQGNELTGTLELDARDMSPGASLLLEAEAFDTGAVLGRLGLAQDIDAQMSKLRLQVAVRGSRLGEVLEKSSFLASFESATLARRDAGTQSGLNLALASGELRAEAGGPVRGLVTGEARAGPVRLDFEGDPLRGMLPPSARWPFAISAAFADAQWEISGTNTPGPTPGTELWVSLSGGRLNDLDVLLAATLPPWGPYEFTGRLNFAPPFYRVEEARIAIGDSLLLGSGSLDAGARPASFEAMLRAPVVQLDDFALGDWSPLPGSVSGLGTQAGSASGSGRAGRMTTDSARRAFTAGVESVHPFFSRERLSLGNGRVEIRVDRMLAGADELGEARFAASLIDGAATLGPIEIDGRSGRAKVMIAYEPREHDAVFSARALVDRLDYGLVVSRVKPELGINGVVSLDLAIDATAPELNQVMKTASGYIDLAFWPDSLRWGGFDLWAANLMRSLLPFFSPTSSHLNCVIGHFNLDKGLLVSQALLIDTTNTRAMGWAQADFVTERLRMRFVPRHKRPRLVSLAIPVEVRGTFSDYRIALRPTDALGRVAQWFKTLVQVPLHWLGVGRIPGDGRDVCAEPARQ